MVKFKENVVANYALLLLFGVLLVMCTYIFYDKLFVMHDTLTALLALMYDTWFLRMTVVSLRNVMNDWRIFGKI